MPSILLPLLLMLLPGCVQAGRILARLEREAAQSSSSTEWQPLPPDAVNTILSGGALQPEAVNTIPSGPPQPNAIINTIPPGKPPNEPREPGVVMPRSISEAPTRTTTVAAFTTTYTSPSWITIPVAQMTSDPFCHNEADPDEGIGNHCVCSNGETVSVIPWTTGGNISDYQPCAYTTAAYIAKISDTPPCHAVPITTVFAVADGTTIPITTSMVTCVG